MKSKDLIKYIFIISAASSFLLPTISLAAAGDPITLNLDYPCFGPPDQCFDLNKNQDLNQIIAGVYYFIVMSSGLAAFVMLVWAGVQWMSSAGNPTAISDAKDRMQKALLGLLLILMSYAILNIINPDLTTLGVPTL